METIKITKRAPLFIRLPNPIKEALKEIAEKEGVSLNEFATEALKQALRDRSVSIEITTKLV